MRKVFLLIFFVMTVQMFGVVSLNAAGATFPEPLYVAMFREYTVSRVNYQGVGSGAGIRQLIARTVDFAGTDAPMTAEEIANAGGAVLHIPMALGAVVLAYNLPGNPKLRLDAATIGGIYLGTITKWNDSNIVALNPGVTLPDINIVPVRRSDSSGTTFIFTDYLLRTVPAWSNVGRSRSPSWPMGIGGRGNAGVAALIRQVPGSIGYVESAFAEQNNLMFADVRNAAGVFINPTNERALSAALTEVPTNGLVDVVNSSARDAYPITGATWIILHRDLSYLRDQARARAIVDTIWWMVTDGQRFHRPLGYGPLSPRAVTVAQTLLRSVVFDGRQVRR